MKRHFKLSVVVVIGVLWAVQFVFGSIVNAADAAAAIVESIPQPIALLLFGSVLLAGAVGLRKLLTK